MTAAWFVAALCVLATPAANAQATADAILGEIRAGKYGDAERHARELLATTERLHGPISQETAAALDLLAAALRLGGKAADPEGLEICLRVIRLKEESLAPDDSSLAVSLENLGSLHLSNGDLTRARLPLERARDLRLGVFGPNHPLVARSLLYLVNLEHTAHHDDVALSLIGRAIEIHDATLPPEDPARAMALNMLAVIRYDRGEYREAGSVYEQVLSLLTRTVGLDHPTTASTLHNLGALSWEMGDYDEARRYLHRALAAMRRGLRRGHPLVARSLTVLAGALESSGDPDSARSRYQEALRIQRKNFGAKHAEPAWTMTKIGGLDVRRGRIARARKTLGEALGIQEKVLAPGDTDLAWTLCALSEAELRSGSPDQGLEHARRALTVFEATLGTNHPDVARPLTLISDALLRRGEAGAALDAALRAAAIRETHLSLVAGGVSERQALAYAAVGPSGLDLALAVLGRADLAAPPGSVLRTWDAVARARTLVLDEMVDRHHVALRDSADTGVLSSRERLKQARDRLANLLVRGPRSESPEQYEAIVRLARLEMERAERDLADRSAHFRMDREAQERDLLGTFGSIPPRWGMIAYVSYAAGEKQRYAAFVQGADGEPTFVPLDDAARTDSLVLRWTRDVVAAPADEGAARRAESVARTVGSALRAAIWDPVARALGDVEGVLIVPEGAVHAVNFVALPTGRDAYLVEGPLRMHYLESERDLAAPPSAAEGAGLLAFGGIDFDRRAEAAPPSVGSDGGSVPLGGPSEMPTAPWDCSRFREARFTALPQSLVEVREIAAAWGDSAYVQIVTGLAASEAAFKRLAPGKRVIHLATHGFFLDPDRCLPWGENTRGIGGIQTSVRRERPKTFTTRSPLLLSGLALASANRRAEAARTEEDGILTAEEVASLDLRGTAWAVLSACDTGLSGGSQGEGIRGLRRAFRVAGVSTLVISLWPVEDQAAREWMRSLYHARFRDGGTTADAVRHASVAVLQSRRAQGRSTHPIFWAAFLASGDWH